MEDGIPPVYHASRAGSLAFEDFLRAMYYVYVLENGKGKHYIGSCQDLAQRLKQHNQNCVCSTKNRGPFRIIYREAFGSRTEARKRENELKRCKGSNAFRKLINTLVPIV